MSIASWKITKSSIESLSFPQPDFDSITTQLPSGLYTTFRTYAERTKVIGLRAHLRRLYDPAKGQKIDFARSEIQLRGILAESLMSFAHESRVRLILDTTSQLGTLYILIQELQPLPEDVYQNGVRAVTMARSRVDPKLKSTSFISESSRERSLVHDDVFEVLLTHNRHILEGMTSNFFYVRDGALYTASRGILNGITRQTVISLTKEAEIQMRYKSLRLDELSKIDEAFITSSSRGIVPVVQIETQIVKDGKVGKMTNRLMKLYEQNILDIAESIL